MKVKNDVNHVIEKAVLTGVITGVGGNLMFPGAQYTLPALISAENTQIPFPLVCGAIGALNSGVIDGLHLGVNKGIPLPQKAKDLTTFTVGAGVSALSMYGLLLLGNVNIGITNSALLGIAGEVAGGLAFYFLKEKQYL